MLENKAIRVSSILSTISVELNMPEYIFILASVNTYKLMSIIWKYGNIPLTDARNYEIILALIQAIGRNARKSNIEIEQNLPTYRCVLISKADVFSNTINVLRHYSQQFYKEVQVIDLEEFENLLSNNFKSKSLINYYNFLQKFKDYDIEIYNFIYPFGIFNNAQKIKILIIFYLLSLPFPLSPLGVRGKSSCIFRNFGKI